MRQHHIFNRILIIIIGAVLASSALLFVHLQATPSLEPKATEGLQPNLQVHEEGITLELPFVPVDLLVRLTLYTPAGPIHKEVLGEGRSVRFTLPYARAGLTPYRLSLGNEIISGELVRQPGPPVTPLALKLGPRAVRVTGSENSALIVYPLDAQGNVSDEPVEVTALSPKRERWKKKLEVQNLLAWTWLPQTEAVGAMKVSAVSGKARGERAEVDLLPGFAVRGYLEGIVTQAPATGRDSWRVGVSDLKDAVSNEVTDGSALYILGEGRGFNFSFTRPAVYGGTEFVLPTHSLPGGYMLEARAGLYRSTTVEVTATPAFAQKRLRLVWLDGPLRLLIGPVWDALGALPDDGTPVLIQLLDAEGEELYQEEVLLLNGQAVWTPPLAAEGVRVTLSNLVIERALPEAP